MAKSRLVTRSQRKKQSSQHRVADVEIKKKIMISSLYTIGDKLKTLQRYIYMC